MNETARRKVLIVDDDEQTLSFAARILDEAGYEVWRTQEPRNVLHLIQGGSRPDLIVTDVDMPGLKGTELCVLLKNLPETRRIPILFTSGMTRDQDHLLADFCGGAAYLDKPYEAAALVAVVYSLLEPAPRSVT